MLTIDLNSPTPLAEQIRRGIRQSIASGDLAEGDPLPPVRQLASDLGINFNTVARAYRELEGEGLVISRRGRGTIVTSGAVESSELSPESQAQVSEAIRNLLADARLAGMSNSEIEAVFRSELSAFESGKETTP